MLLAGWGATMGRPAFITSTVFDILGSAPRSFRQWVADHANAFMEGQPHRADLRHGQLRDQGHQGTRLQGTPPRCSDRLSYRPALQSIGTHGVAASMPD